MESSNYNSKYTIVQDRKDADGAAWGFHKPTQDMPTMLYYKFVPLQDDEVRFQVEWAGLCQSDVHNATNDWGEGMFPMVTGHEIVGKVSELGSKVTKFKVGDKIGWGVFGGNCGDCEMCMDGHDNLCHSRIMTYGAGGTFGGYNTHYQGKAKYGFHLPDNLYCPESAPLMCAGATLFGAYFRNSRPGDEVAVIGIGGLGHLGVQFGNHMACRVTAFSGSKDHESIKKLGASAVVNSRDLKSVQAQFQKFDTVITTVPHVSPEFDKAFQAMVKPHGKFVQVGIPGHTQKSEMDHIGLVFYGKEIVGQCVCSWNEYHRMLKLASMKNILPIAEVFKWEDCAKGYHKLKNGKPHFRACLEVGPWARENGFHK